MMKGHAEALAPTVQDLMADAGVNFAQLNRIAVTTGPGTFTGLRIALSFARGLGVALKIPVIGFSTLEAMAMRAQAANDLSLPIWAIIDARREEAYVQSFNATGEPTSKASISPLAEIRATLPPGPVLWIGSGTKLVARPEDKTGLPSWPDARILAQAALSRPDPGHPPHPFYLRASDAKPKLLLTGGIRLLKAMPTHAEILSAIHSECFPEGWSAESFATLLANPAHEARLALGENDEPEGFILASRIVDEAEIISLAVRPAFRRKGLATMLLARFSEELGSNATARIFLDVAATNYPAQALYQAAGFVISGRRKNYYSNGDDAILMHRAC
jgi:tRNA threonylcarbamoyladenosine biosynthesis protein TsaB